MVNGDFLRIQFCLQSLVLFQDGGGIGFALGIQLGSQSLVGHGQNLSGQQGGVDTAVDGHGGYGDAGVSSCRNFPLRTSL